MWFSEADSAALGRCLAQIADQPSDVVDLFLEQRTDWEIRADEPGPGALEWRESGFAVRLVREGCTFLGARDEFVQDSLLSVLREVARAAPSVPYRVPELHERPFELGEWEELADLPSRLRRSIRERHAAVDFRLRAGKHSRVIQLVGQRLLPAEETESFFSLSFHTPWGRCGYLLADLEVQSLEPVVDCLLDRLRARNAEAVTTRVRPLVFGPAATAVLLHEAVAHALEADTLVLSGRAEAAIGVDLGGEILDVLDNPAEMPAGLARVTDDEGMPVVKRWLLQAGRVSQPLADRFHAERSGKLMPGAARRSSRHLPPVPRSTHLQLAQGKSSFEDLMAEGAGYFLPEISRGRLDPVSGGLSIEFPYGRHFENGKLGDWVGPGKLDAPLTGLLEAIVAAGDQCHFTGAGWCAKGGHRLPVWATCPAVRLEGLSVSQ